MNLKITKEGIYLNDVKIADYKHKLEETVMIEINVYVESGSK